MIIRGCPKCKIGTLDKQWDIWGEDVYCINCGWRPRPPLTFNLEEEEMPYENGRKRRVAQPPKSGKDCYSDDHVTRRRNQGLPPKGIEGVPNEHSRVKEAVPS